MSGRKKGPEALLWSSEDAIIHGLIVHGAHGNKWHRRGRLAGLEVTEGSSAVWVYKRILEAHL